MGKFQWVKPWIMNAKDEAEKNARELGDLRDYLENLEDTVKQEQIERYGGGTILTALVGGSS